MSHENEKIYVDAAIDATLNGDFLQSDGFAQEFPETARLISRSRSSFMTTAKGGYIPTGIIPNLPNEIFIEITTLADWEDLPNLALVSSTFRAASEPHLYRHLCPKSRSKMIKCLRILIARPRLAHHVHTCVIGDPQDREPYLRAFFNLLSRALRNMHNLTELDLCIFGSYAHYLLGCSFRLRNVLSACDWDPDFVTWLEEQPELRTLLVCPPSGEPAVPKSHALPYLSRVSGPPAILSACVPGRPVTNVEACFMHPMLVNEDSVGGLCQILAHSKGPLQDLLLVVYLRDLPADIVIDALHAIPKELPKLESFSIYAASGRVTREICVGLNDVLAQFHSLKRLSIYSKEGNDLIHDASAGKELAVAWNASRESLHAVTLAGTLWILVKDLGWITYQDLELALLVRQRALLAKEQELLAAVEALTAQT